MKLFYASVLVALMAGAAICAAEDTLHTKSSTTDSSGTTVTREKSTKASKGILGTERTQTDETTEVDPKGMFNKTETTRHEGANIRHKK